MSSFRCEICGKDILDTPAGYITECEHYPREYDKSWFRKSQTKIYRRKTKPSSGQAAYGAVMLVAE